MDHDRHRRLAEFDEAWRQMRAVLERMAAEERAGRPPDGPVTAAQAIRHVADWDRFSADAAEQVARGAPDPIFLPDGVQNARWLSDDFYVTLDEALQQLDEAHQRRRELAVRLDEDGWRRTEGAWIGAAAEHYRDHAREPPDYPIDRDESRAILEARRVALLERLRREAHHAGTQPGVTVTLGAAIAHIARWDEASVEVLEARRRNADAPDPYAGRDREWNARWLREDAATDAADALVRLERASVRLLVTLAEIDERLWRRDGPRYALGTAEHYRSHTEDPLAFPLPAAAVGANVSRGVAGRSRPAGDPSLAPESPHRSDP